jgi:hypothetical protein
MTARVRRASPPVACAHHGDVRDCGTCVAAKHDSTVNAAEVRAWAAPPTEEDPALFAFDDAKAAREGHRVLRENGIGAYQLTAALVASGGYCVACRGAGWPFCRNLRCPGRRVRCELPEVRR